MRSTLSSIGVFVIVAASCLELKVGASGVVSRMERVAELMINNPDRCGQHGTAESEIIPVVNCGKKKCKLPTSICQYNFVVDQFACFNLSGDCKQLIFEKMKVSKSRWAKKRTNKTAIKSRRNQIIESVLRARSRYEEKIDETEEKSEKVVDSSQRLIPAVVRKTKAGELRIRPNKSAPGRFRALGAKIINGEPIEIDSLVRAQVTKNIKEEKSNASESISQSPRARSKKPKRKIRRKLVRSRSRNRKAKAHEAEIQAHPGISIPLPSDNSKSLPRALSLTEIRAANTEALSDQSKSEVRPLSELVDDLKQQSATPTSSTETPLPVTTQSDYFDDSELTFIHLPSNPQFGQKAGSSEATTVASKERNASVEPNSGNTEQLAKVVQRHRLDKNNNRTLIGERLLAIRPSQSATQTSEVKQISESIDGDSEKQPPEHVGGEKQPSAEPEPTKSLTDEKDSSHEQPAPEPTPTKVVDEKSAPGDSKSKKVVQSHESVPGLSSTTTDDETEHKEEPTVEPEKTLEGENKEEVDEFFRETGSKEKEKEEFLSAEEGETDEAASEVEGSGHSEDGQLAQDWHKSCCQWASEGHCFNNRAFMLPMCQKSCGSYRCMWDNLDECGVKVDLSHCVNRSPVLSKVVDELTTGVVRRRRLRTKVHTSGRTVVLEEPIPLTLQPISGHRGIRVALRKVIDN